GCEMTHTYMVDGPDALLCEIITTNEVEGDDGSVCVEVEGGTPDYEIQWSTGNNTECVYDLSDGEYIVTVIDENGCTCASTGVVYVGTDEWTAPQILVTPNPVMDQLTITGLTGTATSIDLLDMTGRKIRSLTNVQNGTINVDDLAAGKYALVIKHIERAPDVVTFVKR
ncbi:MAG: T9SS type A sorting domain-containing protein, partial [Flavobacteriales bacterium]|nr:T9SS type A sorting domain-containing protein [Flavobacteriales bacterium]